MSQPYKFGYIKNNNLQKQYVQYTQLYSNAHFHTVSDIIRMALRKYDKRIINNKYLERATICPS